MATARGNPTRNLGGGALQLVDLAVGTHVFGVTGLSRKGSVDVMVASAAGTANIDFTFDPGVISDGVAPPSEDFAAGVVSTTWATGASADASERLVGAVTGVRVTVATNVATVVIAPGS